jgi:hypothetical protein
MLEWKKDAFGKASTYIQRFKFSIQEQHLNPIIYKLKNELIKAIIGNHVLLVQKNICILKATGKTCASTNKDINSMSSSQK